MDHLEQSEGKDAKKCWFKLTPKWGGWKIPSLLISVLTPIRTGVSSWLGFLDFHPLFIPLINDIFLVKYARAVFWCLSAKMPNWDTAIDELCVLNQSLNISKPVFLFCKLNVKAFKIAKDVFPIISASLNLGSVFSSGNGWDTASAPAGSVSPSDKLMAGPRQYNKADKPFWVEMLSVGQTVLAETGLYPGHPCISLPFVLTSC